MARKTTPPAAEAAEQTTPQAVEQMETATATPERDKFPDPCVYCGPSVRGVARQFTTYQGGIPEPLREFVEKHPAARGLIVSTGKFASVRKRLDIPGTSEAILYKRVKSEI